MRRRFCAAKSPFFNPGVINALLTFLYISRFATSCAFVLLDCKLRRSWVTSVLFFAARSELVEGDADCEHVGWEVELVTF